MTAPRQKPECSLPCDLCGGRDVEELSAVDREGRHLRTVLCRGCGLVYSDPRPLEVREYYEKDYRLDYKATYTPKLKHVYRSGRVALERIQVLASFLEPGFRVVDIGAGGGELVYILRKLGVDAIGLEPNQGYAQYAADVLGVPVSKGFYEDAPLSPGSSNLVTMFHVVEHLESPTEAFSRAYGWLAPHGYLVVEVPNIETVSQWPRNRFHRAHLYNFNSATLAMLGTKTGFRTVRCEADGNLSIIFQKTSEPRPSSVEIPGNCERVRAVIRGHTSLRHLFTPHPYLRPIQRLRSSFKELSATRRRQSARELLDELLAPSGLRIPRRKAA